jgi:GNAT superfamily N-acetyltransferase
MAVLDNLDIQWVRAEARKNYVVAGTEFATRHACVADGTVWVTPSAPNAIWSCAMISDGASRRTVLDVEQIFAHHRSLSAFTVEEHYNEWLAPVLVKRGYVHVATLPVMAYDLTKHLTKHQRGEKAMSYPEPSMSEWNAKARLVYGNLPRSIVPSGRVQLRSSFQCNSFMALCVSSPATVGAYWVGTSPAARGKGLATGMMLDALDLASVIAKLFVLQSASNAYSFYRQLGFVEVTRYRQWVKV